MTDDEVKAVLPRLCVVARAMPGDKTRLVKLSQELNLVVGMTGDGVNDAPALKLADVGFCMGSGTDIAKSAADIVILDNSFEAIKKTVLYGRTIFKSIRKFITFQLSMNLSACGVSLIGQFIGIETPITIIQMLWVNIIMDTLGGLAFAGEPAVDHYMQEKPKSRNEQILSKDMLNQIGYTGFFTLFLCVFFLVSDHIKHFYGFYTSTDAFYTAFYALFIFCGIFNCFVARSERLFIMSNISKNKLFILIMLLIVSIQIIMIYFGGAMFRCVPLTTKELFFVINLSFTIIPFDCVRRIIKKLS
jgi:magnesium-transporting ATPase (P-type)